MLALVSLVGLLAMLGTVLCSCVYMYVNGSLVYGRAIETWGLRVLQIIIVAPLEPRLERPKDPPFSSASEISEMSYRGGSTLFIIERLSFHPIPCSSLM